MHHYNDQFYAGSHGQNTSHYLEENLVDLLESEIYSIRSFIIEKNFAFKILNIKKVKNNFLEAFYELKKAEIRSRFKIPPKEIFLIHVTSVNNVKNIAKNNFDWRRITRAKFGIGTSFTDDAQYAHRYANYNIGDNRALIICKVLVSRSTRGHKDQSQLSPLYDTSIGNNNNVYVKFDDNEMLPMFVIYYHSKRLAAPLSNVNQLVCPQSRSLERQNSISLLSNDQQILLNVNNLLIHELARSQSNTPGRQSSRPLPSNAQQSHKSPRHANEYWEEPTVQNVHRPSQPSISYAPRSDHCQSQHTPQIIIHRSNSLESISSSMCNIPRSDHIQSQYTPQNVWQMHQEQEQEQPNDAGSVKRRMPKWMIVVAVLIIGLIIGLVIGFLFGFKNV